MSIKNDDPKEELFWLINFVVSGILIVLFFGLQNSDRFIAAFSNREGILRFVEYGLWFLLAYAGSFTGLYIYRGGKKNINRGMTLVVIVEIAVILIRIWIGGVSGLWGILFVVLANAITVLEVLAHERLLV